MTSNTVGGFYGLYPTDRATVDETFPNDAIIAIRNIKYNGMVSACGGCWTKFGYKKKVNAGLFSYDQYMTDSVTTSKNHVFIHVKPDDIKDGKLTRYALWRVKNFGDGYIALQNMNANTNWYGKYISPIATHVEFRTKKAGPKYIARCDLASNTTDLSSAKLMPIQTEGGWSFYSPYVKEIMGAWSTNQTIKPPYPYGIAFSAPPYVRDYHYFQVYMLDMQACCMGQNTPTYSANLENTVKFSSEMSCGPMWENHAVCDTLMRDFCSKDENKDNDYCTCFTSPVTKYPPVCVDAKCSATGYATQTMRRMDCPDVVDCATQISLGNAGRDITTGNFDIQQNCGGGGSATVDSGSGGDGGDTGNGGNGDGTGYGDGGDTGNGDNGGNGDGGNGDSGSSTNNQLYLFLGFIFLIMIAVGAYFMIGDDAPAYSQQYPQQYPQQYSQQYSQQQYSQPQYPQQQYPQQQYPQQY